MVVDALAAGERVRDGSTSADRGETADVYGEIVSPTILLPASRRPSANGGLNPVRAGAQYSKCVRPTLSYLEEGHNVHRGIWWAVVTATTVGYGNVVPSTGFGRLLATVLMFVGISFIALLSAASAARLVELESEEGQEELLQGIRGAGRREQEMHKELREVNERLARLEDLLSSNGKKPD